MARICDFGIRSGRRKSNFTAADSGFGS